MKEIRRQISIIALLTGLLAGFQPAVAQYTSNFQTNTMSGGASYWAGDYVVGSNTFANALMLRGGSILTNADGYAGYMPMSSSNYVMVAGAGSTWSNANLYLGYSGSQNRLVITNGGKVANNLGTYIALNPSSGNNSVLVTGTNSTLTCANFLELGTGGSGNSLVISNGGQVFDSYCSLGSTISGNNNSALITGTNSMWNNAGSCTVGGSGSNNRLTINKGGRMVSNYAQAGTWDTAVNNSIVVSDPGSLWDDSAEASVITFGANGSGNSLIVTNGGHVLGYYAYFGRFTSAGNNFALVSGSNSSFSVNCYIYTGDQGHDNTFTAANGAAIADKFCYISYSPGSSNNAVLLAGPNTFWTNSYSTFVGFDGVAASLTISNGATMGDGGAWATSHDGALGVNADSSNNVALVTGGGSTWNCADNMYVGLNGPGNNLAISSGGRVINTEGYVGSNPGSDHNNALVTGANSLWTNNGDFFVGYFGSLNSLTISNGARVVNGYGAVGETSGSISNNVLITGPGSIWINRNTNLYVGCYGSANSLVITNGGRVNDDWGTIGFDVNSVFNQALVAGAGSIWSNSTVVFVGDYGSSNSLVIRDGGLVSDYWGLMGEEDSANDNYVSVESGGVWRNDQLAIGDWGSHNALNVDGGSVFVSTYMAVGYDPVYANNFVELLDGQIIVTNAAHNAVLEVYGGGMVQGGGTLWVDTLVITNAAAQFMYIGGTLAYRNLIITPEFDADSDGIPNGWEQAHGLDPLNPDDAAADNDSDGMSNLQEYLAGTDPNNAASRFAVTSLALTNGHVRVSWSAVGGKSYVVQTNSALGTSFADASPLITVPGTSETVTNYLDPGLVADNQARYYRVRLGP